ncbi:MAG TPA: AAA family ATPase [Bacillota bacterium]|nr:AAA family ATPase [Bacillota bacterium]
MLHFIQSIKRMIKYIADRFEELLKKNSEVTEGKVVVLIDEYDEPIIDHIEEQIHFCNS